MEMSVSRSLRAAVLVSAVLAALLAAGCRPSRPKVGVGRDAGAVVVVDRRSAPLSTATTVALPELPAGDER